MTFSKKPLICLALGASVISISACSYGHPNAMPSGYTYHHEDYKSPVPSTSSKVTIEQRKYMDAAQAEQFRDAVYDLLERLTMRAGMAPKPVYVMAPDPMTTFYANLDNDLRESMRHIGYAISDTPEGAYIFTYEALPLASLKDQPSNGSNNVQLTLRVFNMLSKEAQQLTEESGQYFIHGVESLNVIPASYRGLPSQKEIAKRQLQPAKPAPVVAPAVQTPVATPMVRSPQEPMFAKPAVRRSVPAVTQPTARRPMVSQPEIEIQKQVAPTPKAIPPVKRSVKKPSHNDIVIINRGDKPVMDVEIPTAPAPEPNALQDAIPTVEKAVRGRVSQPVDY